MSIRTNPKKAVHLLLKRVRSVRNVRNKTEQDKSLDKELEELTKDLKRIEDLFEKVKRNEDALLDELTKLDGHLRKLDKEKSVEYMAQIRDSISNCADKLLPKESLKQHSEIPHSNPSSNPSSNKLLPQDQNEYLIGQSYELLDRTSRKCLDSLLVFPKDAVIKTRHAIYLWIGLDYLNSEKLSFESVTKPLLDNQMIIPYGNATPGREERFVKKFKINPLIHLELRKIYNIKNHSLLLEQQRVTLGGKDPSNETKVLFNAGTKYVNFESQWLAKQKNLEVLQLGRWQASPLHHIEVGSEEFLKELRGQKQLRYLSLCGISRIFDLPPSIAQLESLKILDLKACHNLETLPDDIASVRSLTHLILSKCYLLEAMPKGIEKLTRLQVLKGFVISSPIKTPCKLSDLANLKDLRRLSVHIASEAKIDDTGFGSLIKLSSLEHLKISWGVSDKKYSDIPIILPLSLKKLHIEGFRGQIIPGWMKPKHAASKMQRAEYNWRKSQEYESS